MKNNEYVNGIPNFGSPVEKHTRKLKFLFHFPITFSTCDSASWSVRNCAVRRPATFTLPRKEKTPNSRLHQICICSLCNYSTLLPKNMYKRLWKKRWVTTQRNDNTLANGTAGSRPWDKGGGGRRSPKKFFSALRASVWSKKKWGGGGGGGPPAPSHGSAAEWYGLGCAGGQIGQ